MLRVVHYLKEQKQRGENPLEKLKSEFGVESKKHPEHDLYILDYSQIDSPRFNPIVDECRGLVIDGNFDLVSKGFSRFYNLGEGPNVIDWTQPVHVTTKQDGSMIHIFNHKDNWFVNTRFSWGDGEVNLSGFTWRQLVEKHLDYEKLSKTKTYVFELCGPYNKVVRTYSPTLFLLAVFSEGEEYPHWCIQYESERIGIKATETHEVKSESHAVELLNLLSKKDPTFEGFVFRDWKDDRCKVKTAAYLALHKLGTGNAYLPKYLVPIILSGETEELLCYFQELKPKIEEIKQKIDEIKKEIETVWELYKNIENQKEFAISIISKTKYTNPLFQAKKFNTSPFNYITSEYLLKTLFS